MGQFLPILALLVLAVVFAGISLVAQRILVPRRPTEPKVAPYECGILDVADPPERFPVRFYLIAMIFIVFDIEIIFFYPFTQVYGALGWFGLVAIGIFTIAVFESFLYLISNGALDWGPPKHLRRSRLMADPERTTASTVRHVGTEGRPAAALAAAPASDHDGASGHDAPTPDRVPVGAH
ncbi:MAG: NADH-quinone oxidoreductase subunit A [Actinobacteria bacterium]|nr:NADH-quinone oxidoreductase subunit A [Actinomycetota bacterium]